MSFMTTIAKEAGAAKICDRHFVGTVAFKNEECALPDGSKAALGIDGCHWVLIDQRTTGGKFTVYRFDQSAQKLLVDEKEGTPAQLKDFKTRVKYFFDHAETDDLVTLIPLRGAEND